MPRFHCPQPLAAGLELDLPEAVAHHLFVVRMQAGAPLTLFNGDGGEWTAELVAVEKRRARVRVHAHVAREAELPGRVTLAQGLPEGSKMDWIVEKAVELGVAAVQPLALARSVVRLSAERSEKRVAHWRAVAVAACEQSGRNQVPEVAAPLALRAWLDSAPGQLVVLSPRASASLAGWAARQRPPALALLIGPEGGLTEEEEAAALRAGALALSIGPRVLRTETAGLAALAVLGAAWES